MSEPLLKKRCQDGKKVSGASESEGIFAPQGLSHFFVTCFMFLLFLVEDDKCLNDSSQSYMAVFKYLENSFNYLFPQFINHSRQMLLYEGIYMKVNKYLFLLIYF